MSEMDIKSEKKSDDDLEAELEEMDSEEGDVKDLTIERLKEEIRLLKGRIKALEFNIEFEREAFERERRQAQEEIDSLKRERYLLRKQLDELLKPPLLLGEIIQVVDEIVQVSFPLDDLSPEPFAFVANLLPLRDDCTHHCHILRIIGLKSRYRNCKDCPENVHTPLRGLSIRHAIDQ